MHRYAVAPMLALSLLACTAGEAFAKPITYTLGFKASGVVDGKPFTNQDVEVRPQADTSQVTSTPGVTTLTLNCSPSVCRAYVAGLGFASIIKFKAHKDNPTQLKLLVSGKSNASVTLTKQRFGSDALGTPLAPTEVKVAFKAPLTFQARKGGRPTTVTLTSIADRSLTFEAE
jgi:hypothetical protein